MRRMYSESQLKRLIEEKASKVYRHEITLSCTGLQAVVLIESYEVRKDKWTDDDWTQFLNEHFNERFNAFAINAGASGKSNVSGIWITNVSGKTVKAYVDAVAIETAFSILSDTVKEA